MPRLVYTLFFVLSLTQMAAAHNASPYLLPDQFDIESKQVSVQSAITVEKFFTPTRAFNSQLLLTTPEQGQHTLTPSANFAQFQMFAFDAPLAGTYRLQTSEAEPTANEYAKVDGRWLRIRTPRAAPTTANAQQQPESPNRPAPANNNPPRMILANLVPENSPRLRSNIIPVAETYLSKGKPSAIPQPQGQGIELQIFTHPNELFVGDTFRAKVLFNGQPVAAGLEFDVYKGASRYQRGAKREQPSVTTNEQGEISVALPESGVYLLSTQYPILSTDNTQPPPETVYQYGLTFEVTE